MKNLLFFIYLLFVVNTVSYAQQTADWKFNLEDQFLRNPAAISLFGTQSYSAYYLKQFTAIQNAPTDMYLAAQIPITDQNLSVGAALMNESIGPLGQTRVNISASYKLRSILADDDYIALGLSAVGSQLRLDGSQIKVTDINDPFTPLQTDQALSINVGTGIFYSSRAALKSRYNSPVFQLGLAYNQSLPQNINIDAVSYEESAYLYGLAKVIVPYGNNSSISFQIESAYESFDLLNINGTVQAAINNSILVGTSFDKDMAAGLQVGYRHNSFYGSTNWEIVINTVTPLGLVDRSINTGFGVSLRYNILRG